MDLKYLRKLKLPISDVIEVNKIFKKENELKNFEGEQDLFRDKYIEALRKKEKLNEKINFGSYSISEIEKLLEELILLENNVQHKKSSPSPIEKLKSLNIDSVYKMDVLRPINFYISEIDPFERFTGQKQRPLDDSDFYYFFEKAFNKKIAELKEKETLETEDLNLLNSIIIIINMNLTKIAENH